MVAVSGNVKRSFEDATKVVTGHDQWPIGGHDRFALRGPSRRVRVQSSMERESAVCVAPRDAHGCLILDVGLPRLSGIDLQRELATREVPPPIVFVTGRGDIAIAAHTMKRGREHQVRVLVAKGCGNQEIAAST